MSTSIASASFSERRLLHHAAHARGCSNSDLLQRIVATVLRENLIDAVIDDDPIGAAYALSSPPGGE